MNHLVQHRTVKSPCCNKKTRVTFQYGALRIGAFCDCGRPFYLRFRKVKSRREGHKGPRAGRLMRKSKTNHFKPKRHRKKAQTILRKKR